MSFVVGADTTSVTRGSDAEPVRSFEHAAPESPAPTSRTDMSTRVVRRVIRHPDLTTDRSSR
jgi:hypothetical protein